jgi:nitroimidazol reductase NimA-like FMN-containing flavoprotein (pyridoxamine 5'-phosphate oxidase superfamily)
MQDEQSVRECIQGLFDRQSLAVLATDADGHPYGSLVGFAAADDLHRLLFATTRATQKFRNLQSNPRVSLLIDNRKNTEEDFHEACAVTALGTARELNGNERGKYEEIFLEKHPALMDFVRSPNCSLLSVSVATYYLVCRFQSVIELRMDQ